MGHTAFRKVKNTLIQSRIQTVRARKAALRLQLKMLQKQFK